MIWVEVVLDEEVLGALGYDLNQVWAAIDSAFVGHGIYKDGQGVYKGSGLNTDFAYFGVGALALAKQPWFMENVSKWLWYNSDMSASEDDFCCEDLHEGFWNYYLQHRHS